jgi:hypothetical protein
MFDLINFGGNGGRENRSVGPSNAVAEFDFAPPTPIEEIHTVNDPDGEFPTDYRAVKEGAALGHFQYMGYRQYHHIIEHHWRFVG